MATRARHRSLVLLVASSVVTALSFMSIASAQSGEAAELGRRLFMGYEPIAHGASVGSVNLPAAASACAGCHGNAAEGLREGGQAAPSLQWESLSRSRGTAPAYDDTDAVLAAVERGIGRGDAKLQTRMPRFQLEPEEREALAAYLRIAGTDADQPPGVTVDSIRVGTALPLHGSAAPVGEAVRDGLMSVVEAANRRGGVHGRTIQVEVIDVPSAAEAARVATVQFVRSRPLYALVAGFAGDEAREPVANASLSKALADRHVSHIAALSVSSERAVLSGGWVAPLMPSLDDQWDTLRAAVEAACPRAGSLWLVDAHGSRPLPASPADIPKDAAIASADMDTSQAPGCVGRLPLQSTSNAMPLAGWREITVWPVPVALLASDVKDPEAIWRALGRMAGEVLIEALSEAGPRLHERSLLDALLRLDGRSTASGETLNFRRDRLHALLPQVIDSGISRTSQGGR